MANQIAITGSNNIQVYNQHIDTGTQKTVDLFKELDIAQAKFHIAPLGPCNFLFSAALLFLPYFYSMWAYPVLTSATSLEEEIREKFPKTRTGPDRDIRQFEHWQAVQNELQGTHLRLGYSRCSFPNCGSPFQLAGGGAPRPPLGGGAAPYTPAES
ncbi:hypothetical protein M378DRAFT_7836 [Amanita muscaria Koide BX008]|uniref:Uncharacterized protein n=1 Tax=Amanita muscaria (strain Koide BX008) TaxID=946122 RepID=A0A0C2X4D8_AMAMK|nr:hypothetical protein M378DRAFT_7836 [Amanita muscaria Koide BX008]